MAHQAAGGWSGTSATGQLRTIVSGLKMLH